jgi:hypothetical protein
MLKSQRKPLVAPNTLVGDALALATKSPQILLCRLRRSLPNKANTKSKFNDWLSRPQSLKRKLSSRRRTLSRISLACTHGRRHNQTPKGFRRNAKYSRIHSVTPPYFVSFHTSLYRVSKGNGGIDFVKPVMIESLLINLGLFREKLATKPALLAV